MKQRKRKPERMMMVCAPANITLTIPGSSFNMICTRCAQSVMIAPSGQHFLASARGSGPSVQIICLDCFEPKGRDRDSLKQMRLTAAPEVIMSEMMTLTTNYRSRSN